MTLDKGSSIAPADLALLDKPSLIQGRCCLCGDPAQNKHHAPPKSRIPKRMHKRIPLLAVCGIGNTSGCHRLLHGFIEPRYEDEWSFACDDEAARAEVNERREANGLLAAYDPYDIPAFVEPHAEAQDTLPDELTYEAWRLVSAIDNETRTAEWQKATMLLVIRNDLHRTYGIKAGGKLFKEQYTEHGISTTQASRLTDWVEFLAGTPDADTLGVTRGYNAAVAVKRGVLSAEDAIRDAGTLSVSDFRAAYLGAESREPSPLTCPKCGYEDMPPAFKAVA